MHLRQTPGAPPRRLAAIELLGDLGWAVESRGDEPWLPGGAEVVLIWGNAYWFPRLLASLVARPAGERPVVAVWHIEPLPQPDGIGMPWNGLTPRERVKALVRHPGATDPQTNWRRLRALQAEGLPDVLAVASRRGQRFIAEHGIEAVLAPYLWHVSQGRELEPPRERDIDVLFLGTLDAARRRGVLRRLRREGVAVEHAGTFRGPGIWGTERSELLSRARIVLNISRRPGEGSQLRFVLGMSHGAAVVSEPITDPTPFVPGLHYVSAQTDRLAEALGGLLADEQRCRALASAGKRFVLDEMRFEHALDAVLAAVGRVQAARSAGPVAVSAGARDGRRIRPVSR